MSKIALKCYPCGDKPMILLFEIPGQEGRVPATFVFHCEGCGGQVAARDEDEKTTLESAAIKPVKDGSSLVPEPAPNNIQIVRDKLSPEDLRSRLMGQARK